MRFVELHPGISSSVLGFGCAPIMGSVDGTTARRAVAVALEEGITHFDVARGYGFGQAERVLGDCIRRHRNDVVIASKFGIVATSAARALSLFKPMIRVARQHRSPRTQPSSTQSASRGSRLHSFAINILLRRVKLHAVAMTRSVERSLRELKTDYLDYLFLHEPLEQIVEIDSLFNAAQLLKKEGKIRAFGLALLQEQARLHQCYLSRFDILQMDNSPFRQNYSALLEQRAALPTVFFSPFRASAEFSRVDNSKPAHILQQMHKDFPRSVILVSMFREPHIRENARAFAD